MMRSMLRIAALLAAVVGCVNPPDASEDGYPAVRLRLLTDSQHANAVRDLVGEVELDLRTPGVAVDQFVREVGLYEIRGSLLAQYHQAARQAAAAARIDELVPCANDGGEPCARAFIDQFAARAFRRPLESEDRDRLLEVFRLGGYPLVIEAVLSAPDFLYRKELGGPARRQVVDLAPHELAEALSFLLLNSIPDEPLWLAALDGSLAEPAAVAAQVDRLLALPRVRDRVTELVLRWLRIPATRALDTGSVKMVDGALVDSMVDETQQFVADVLWRRGGQLGELIAGSGQFSDAALDEHYGAAPPRAGVLTQAAVLIAASPYGRSVVHRGLYIGRQFLCLPEPPPPPLELLEEVADDLEGLDDREVSEFRAANPACAGCHVTIDPLGLAFDSYTWLGQWREEGDGSSEVTIDGQLHPIAGAAELSEVLAASDEVAACVARQFVEYAFGGPLERSPATAAAIEREFDRDRDLVGLLRVIATSPAFRKREVVQ